jgi:Na+-driven multidrug efflux pump
VAFCVNLGLNLLWIPQFGGVGAAWASLVAYAVVFGLQLLYILSRQVRHAAIETVGATS